MENHRAGGLRVNLYNFVLSGGENFGVMGATLRIGGRSLEFDIYSWGGASPKVMRWSMVMLFYMFQA